MKEIKSDVGVIVGRFMVNTLHDAHIDLINSVVNNHERVVLFLGVAPIRNTLNNPLDARHRTAMINELYPNIEVHFIDDHRDDKVWSDNLDAKIAALMPPLQSVTLYGSRDSFIKSYYGKYPTCLLESTMFISATQVRKKIIVNYPSSKDFRAGLIAATGLRYPTAYQTVDCAVRNNNDEILLVKKPSETKWRFIGGFSDPSSESLEADAEREVMEETGVKIDNICYLGSAKIDDWRYKGSVDCIKTVFFIADYVSGTPEGNDDVEFAKWFDIYDLSKDFIVPEHHVLFDMLKQYC
jgi:bifunctional NMN adenylyltransferase/nudix hydrolase